MPASTKRKASNAKPSVEKRTRPSPKTAQTRSTRKTKNLKEDSEANDSDDETYDGEDIVVEEDEDEEEESGILNFQSVNIFNITSD